MCNFYIDFNLCTLIHRHLKTLKKACHENYIASVFLVQYFPYSARFSISQKCYKSKVLPKPALGVKGKSLFTENTLTFINNYLLLLNMNEITILLSVYTSMTDILTFTATR